MSGHKRKVTSAELLTQIKDWTNADDVRDRVSDSFGDERLTEEAQQATNAAVTAIRLQRLNTVRQAIAEAIEPKLAASWQKVELGEGALHALYDIRFSNRVSPEALAATRGTEFDSIRDVPGQGGITG